MSLEFGVLYEVAIPEPHTPEIEREYMQALVSQVRTAEEVGFTSVWHVEHHFLKAFSHSSASDVLLAAYATATSTIRLGYGVKLLPFNFTHPLKAASAVATLDLISGGRVEFGTGRGLSRLEWEAFDIDPDTARAEWQESLQMIVRAWEDRPFSWDSPSFKIPERDIVPHPYQQPHPPLWMAATSPDTHVVAGQQGLGLLSFSVMVPRDEVARRIKLYRDAIATCEKPIGKVVNNRVALHCNMYCGESEAEAEEVGGPAMEFYVTRGLGYIAGMAEWLAERKGQRHSSLEHVEAFKAMFGGRDPSMIDFKFMNDNDLCIVGDVDTCIEKVRRFRAMGMDLLLGNFQGHGIAPEKVRASIERFGKEVIPACQD